MELVLCSGVPCNQFGEQEPGSAEEIETFCSTTYGISFPMTEKLEVNGPERHPLYSTLTATPDQDGEAGDVQWNFEKFLDLRRRTPGGALSPDGRAGVTGADGGDRVAACLLMAAPSRRRPRRRPRPARRTIRDLPTGAE